MSPRSRPFPVGIVCVQRESSLLRGLAPCRGLCSGCAVDTPRNLSFLLLDFTPWAYSPSGCCSAPLAIRGPTLRCFRDVSSPCGQEPVSASRRPFGLDDVPRGTCHRCPKASRRRSKLLPCGGTPGRSAEPRYRPGTSPWLAVMRGAMDPVWASLRSFCSRSPGGFPAASPLAWGLRQRLTPPYESSALTGATRRSRGACRA